MKKKYLAPGTLFTLSQSMCRVGASGSALDMHLEIDLTISMHLEQNNNVVDANKIVVGNIVRWPAKDIVEHNKVYIEYGSGKFFIDDEDWTKE